MSCLISHSLLSSKKHFLFERNIFEYCSTIWSPFGNCLCRALETIHRKFIPLLFLKKLSHWRPFFQALYSKSTLPIITLNLPWHLYLFKFYNWRIDWSASHDIILYLACSSKRIADVFEDLFVELDRYFHSAIPGFWLFPFSSNHAFLARCASMNQH